MTIFKSKPAYGAGSIVGVVAICLSLYVSTLVLYDSFRLDFGGYKRVDGVVLQSYLKSSSGATGGSSRSSITYSAIIKYSYTIDNITYQGDNRDSLSIKSSSSQRGGSADNVILKYQPGVAIEVWYDIDRPEVSVVTIEERKSLFKLLGALAFAVFGVLSILANRWVSQVRASRDS